jgi:hypothetical protein
MILRAWRGWATADRADEYEHLLNATIAPAIIARGIAGLRDLTVLRRDGAETPGEVEFLTLMTFDDAAAVAEFAGPDPAASVVPPAARAVLNRFDPHSRHYHLVHRHRPDTPAA